MHEIELISQLLKLDDDWHVVSAEVDEPSNRIDITLHQGPQQKKKFFGRGNKDNEQETIALRHLPFAGMRTYLHVPKPAANASAKKVWAAAGSSFTVEMEAFIVSALRSCHTIQAVTQLAHLSGAEAREVSERTGIAPEHHEPSQTASAPAAAPINVEHVASNSFELDQVSNLPSEIDDAWQRLINGEIPIQSSSVALQMLLQRVRQNIIENPTEVTRLASKRTLRQYFIKNQGKHQAEISMLTGDVAAMMSRPEATRTTKGLPRADDLCWQRIINGSLKIDTNEVGLQMIMERVRLSVERNPSEDARVAGSRILHQFFSKHQSRLRSEIQQIGGTSADARTTSATGQSLTPPPATASVWQDIVTGQKTIDTSAVGLQMMMERVRLSVERNPSEASRMAGAKILHQFFLKHQTRLQAEIQQIGGSAASTKTTTGAGQTLTPPPATATVWQDIVTGKKAIDTSAVGLQMMMERVRLSVERNPSDASKQAGAKIIHQFFLKHQTRLHSEIQQIGGTVAASGTIHRSASVSVPADSHPSWQKLINGELEIKTDVVALKMMLERIRISIENNPSDASRVAGAKILRQYFLKHQSKHQAELDQLLAA